MVLRPRIIWVEFVYICFTVLANVMNDSRCMYIARGVGDFKDYIVILVSTLSLMSPVSLVACWSI